jgi:intracellular septation protein A
MQWQFLFLSVAPLVAYMAFWARGQARWAVGAAIAVAGVELGYNSFQLQMLEPFSLLSFVLYLGLGSWSLRVRDDRPFKLQPVIFEISVAAVLIYYYLVLDTPLLTVIVEEHLGLHEVLAAYQRGYATVYATTLSRSLPYLLLLHAVLTAWAAWTASTWRWFNIRVFGFYIMFTALFLGERLLGITS